MILESLFLLTDVSEHMCPIFEQGDKEISHSRKIVTKESST